MPDLPTVLTLIVGYLGGGIPTTDWIANRRGLDLRSTGSGNPGAHNAFRVGGWRLGLSILIVEVLKGVTVVSLGRWMAGDMGALFAGVGAVTGNVLNPYRRLSGGQGLGITLGVLIASWPAVVFPIILVIGGVSALARSAAVGTLIAIVALVSVSLLWRSHDLPVAWGISESGVVALSVGIGIVVTPKQVINLRRGEHAVHTPR